MIGDRGPEGGEESDGPPTDHRLSDLKDQLAAFRERQGGSKGPPPLEAPPRSMTTIAYRLGVEMVVAVALSGALGYVLDGFFGTGPWLMLSMFFLGAAAGFRNVVRACVQLGLMSDRSFWGDDTDGTAGDKKPHS